MPGNGPRIGKLRRPPQREIAVHIVGNKIRRASSSGDTPPGDMPPHHVASLAAAATALLVLPAGACTSHHTRFLN